jgi:hypothetical protein
MPCIHTARRRRGQGRRAQTRHRRLAERVDRELDADRNFFRRFPHRRYFIRRIYPAERAEFERLWEQSLQPPVGFDLFVAVEEVFRGARLRPPFVARISIPLSELREERCRQVFWACMSSREAELREYMLTVAPRERLRDDSGGW